MTRILIVDDKEENLYLLRVLLEGHGYEVELAANGSEAVFKARARRQDMIISDILMPVMDGFTLCKTLKEDERLKHIPLIFYTATYTDSNDEKLALDMGVSAFIIKPAEPDEFMRRIEEILAANKNGKLSASQKQTAGDKIILKEYNAVLINKLEQKMFRLEQVNKALEAEMAARKHAEEALRESEDKYKRLIDNIPDIIFTIGLEGKLTFASRRTQEILGYETTETINMNIFNFIPEEDHQRAIESLQKGMKGEKIKHFQIPLIAKSGERLIFECSFSRVYKDGAVVGAQGTAVDITERKIAETALRESEERYRRIAENMSDFISELDPQGIFKYNSPSIERILGYNQEELIGSSAFDLVHPEDHDWVISTYMDGVKTQSDRYVEQRYRRKDGTYIWLRSSGHPLYGSDGKILE